MVRNLFRKLIGQPAVIPPAIGVAMEQLDRLIHERPAWAGPATILREVLPVMFAETGRIEVPSLTAESAKLKRGGGVPLLRGEPLTFHRETLHHRWQVLVETLQHSTQPEAGWHGIRTVDPGELLQRLLAGTMSEVSGTAPDLLATALRLTVFPELTALNLSLGPFCSAMSWEHGYCPTCGSSPLLGELRGLEQLLFLRCGWCAAEWQFSRLGCPHCGTHDHEQLGYLHVESQQDRERVATCDRCRGYVKLLATLSPLEPVQLLIADVSTLHLDLIAADHNYTRSPCYPFGP